MTMPKRACSRRDRSAARNSAQRDRYDGRRQGFHLRGEALDAKVKGQSEPTVESEVGGNIHRGGDRDERWTVCSETDSGSEMD